MGHARGTKSQNEERKNQEERERPPEEKNGPPTGSLTLMSLTVTANKLANLPICQFALLRCYGMIIDL